jgi:hypothetical protein
MRPNYFYFGTIKNIIAAFGILFRDIEYVTDWGEIKLVPIHYSPKEKFIEMITVSADHDDGYETMVNLPRFGFELISIDYDSTRMTNPMNKISDTGINNQQYMYNRVPYNFAFTLYLATRKFEDSLKIIEQIVPFFTPELNITIKDKEDFGISTDIPVNLNNVGFVIDYQGGFDTRRTISWQLDFSAKAYLYSNIREQTRIKETILSMTDKDFSKVYETFISYIEPRSANKEDPHNIIDKIIDSLLPLELSLKCISGESLFTEKEDNNEKSTPITPMIMASGVDSLVIELMN